MNNGAVQLALGISGVQLPAVRPLEIRAAEAITATTVPRRNMNVADTEVANAGTPPAPLHAVPRPSEPHCSLEMLALQTAVLTIHITATAAHLPRPISPTPVLLLLLSSYGLLGAWLTPRSSTKPPLLARPAFHNYPHSLLRMRLSQDLK